jgi:hypothetical protein
MCKLIAALLANCSTVHCCCQHATAQKCTTLLYSAHLHAALAYALLTKDLILHCANRHDDIIPTATAAAEAAEQERSAALAAAQLMAQCTAPLQQLCTELKAQKRFLARHYRRTAPLQAGKVM